MQGIYQRENDLSDIPGASVFVARQPIFDARQEIFGYELLFRSGMDNFFPSGTDQDFAAARVLLDSFMVFGMKELTGNHRAFINFTRNLLLTEGVTLFPKEQVVVEVLETVNPDDDIIECCKKLKAAGYTLALDDFVYHERFEPLMAMADIVKVDFLTTAPEERLRLVKERPRPSMKYLAERVETKEDFEQARKAGYSYFQGYFFAKPVIMAGKDIPAYKMNYLDILREIRRDDADFDHMERIIKRDVSLTYKLLRFMNSAAFSFKSKVESIRAALALLGMREIRKWLSLVALSSIGKDKPAALVDSALLRALFCEQLAGEAGMSGRREDCFLMGMFSLMDAFLDRPMPVILGDLPLNPDVKTALGGGQNMFRDLYDVVLNYEQADWAGVSGSSSRLHLDESCIPRIFLRSVELVNQLYIERRK